MQTLAEFEKDWKAAYILLWRDFRLIAEDSGAIRQRITLLSADLAMEIANERLSIPPARMILSEWVESRKFI